MEQSHASYRLHVFGSKRSFIWVLSLLFTVMAAIIVWGGPKSVQQQSIAQRSRVVGCTMREWKFGTDHKNYAIGAFSDMSLTPDGELKLSFGHSAGYFSYPQLLDTLKLEWWQIVEREDGHGYPRIDPQSGGSGLPGAKGEDNDPAYYTPADFANPELRARIFTEGRYWLLDKPTLENSVRCESWIVERTGPQSVCFIAGVSWGITVDKGKIVKLHHPIPILRRTHFDWQESLRISGFGSGWEINTAYRSTLP